MSKRKVEIVLGDQENPKKQKSSQNETRNPLQAINQNTVASKINSTTTSKESKSVAPEKNKNPIDEITKKQNDN